MKLSATFLVLSFSTMKKAVADNVLEHPTLMEQHDDTNVEQASSRGETFLRHLQQCSTIRCGLTWTEANGKCGTTCAAWPNPGWDSCSGGEECFANLSSSPCGACGSGTGSATGNSASTTRCGSTWTDANGKCGTTCAAWPNPGWDSCSGGEECFANLSASPCGTTSSGTSTGSATGNNGLPEKVLGGYLRVTWDAGTPHDAVQLNPPEAGLQKYNVLYLFNACHPQGTTPGFVRFNIDTNKYPNLRQNVQNLRSQGVKVILSVGGAGCGMTFSSDPERDLFLREVTEIINDQIGGVDGIDWNTFEQLQLPDANVQRMIYASSQLKQTYGSNFAIVMPPSVSFSQQEYDRKVAQLFDEEGVLDAAFLQFYDGSGNDSPSTFRTRTEQWLSIPLDPEQFGFGMDFGYQSTTLSIPGAVDLWREHDYIRGVFKFDIAKDKANGWEFANAFGPYFG